MKHLLSLLIILLLGVQAQAQCPAFPSITGPASICSGQTITLTVAGAAGTQQFTSNNGSTWQAYTGSTLSVNTAGIYRVRNIANGCTATAVNSHTVAANTGSTVNFYDNMSASRVTGPLAGSLGVASAAGVRGHIAVSRSSTVFIYQSLTDASPVQLPINNCSGLAFSADGSKLLIAQGNPHRVSIYNTIPTVSTATPDVILGQDDINITSSGSATNQFNDPNGLVVMPDGRLYIADRANHRLLCFDKLPTANGTPADVVVGINGLGRSSNRFNSPRGLTLSPQGPLVMADNGNNRLLLFTDLASHPNLASGVMGQTTSNLDQLVSSETYISSPAFISASYRGQVAVSQAGTSQFRVFSSIANGLVPVSAIITNPISLWSTAFLPDGRLLINESASNSNWRIYGDLPCAAPASNLGLTMTRQRSSLCNNVNSFTITVTNPAASAVTDVTIAAALPFGTLNRSATPSAGTFDSNIGSWIIPSLAAGASATLVLTGDLEPFTAQGTVQVMAGIWGANCDDADRSNNGVILTVPVKDALPAVTGPTTICPGGSVTLLAEGGVNYQWAGGPAAASYTVSPASNTVYTVTITDVDGCVASLQVPVVIGTAATPQLFGPRQYCSGKTAYLWVINAGGTQEYSSDGGNNWQPFAGSRIKITGTGDYVVRNRVTGCTTTVSNTITVEPGVSTAPVLSTGQAPSLSKDALFSGGGAIVAAYTGQIGVVRTNRLLLYQNVDDDDPLVFTLPDVRNVCFTPDGGRMLVVQAGVYNRVLVYDPVPTTAAAQPSVVIGQPNFTATGYGSSLSQFNNPSAAVVAPSGRLYVADQDNHRIVCFDFVPTQNGVSASFVLGGSQGTANGSINRPAGLALTSDGRLLVTEAGNHRVSGYASWPPNSGVVPSVLFGQSPASDFSPGSGPTRFTNPAGISASYSGHIAVADVGNNRVNQYSTLPTGLADASAYLGQSSGTGNLPSSAIAGLSAAAGTAYLPDGRLLVNDGGNQRWNVYGDAPCTIADLRIGLAQRPPSSGCTAICTVSVTNSSNNSVSNVLVYYGGAPAGVGGSVTLPTVGTVNSLTRTWFIPTLAPHQSVQLIHSPSTSGIAALGTPRIYAAIAGADCADPDLTNNGAGLDMNPIFTLVADKSLVCPGEKVTLTAAGGTSYSWAMGGAATAVREVYPTENTSYTVNVTNAQGCSDSRSVTVNVFNQALAPAFSYGPTSLCDGDSGVLVLQNLQGTQQYSSNGGSTWTNFTGNTITAKAAGTYQLRCIDGGCTTATASWLVAAQTTAPALSSGQTAASTTSFSNNTIGATAVSCKGMIAVARGSTLLLYRSLTDPSPTLLAHTTVRSMAFTPDGNRLLVSDGSIPRVLVYNTLPTNITNQPDVVIGQDDMTATGGGTGLNRMNDPRGIAVLPDGRLFIADANNHRIMGFNSIPRVNGASAAFATGAFGTSAVNMRNPQGLAFTRDGKLVTTEPTNHRSLVFNSFPTAAGTAASAVIGQASFTGNASSASSNGFNNPQYLAVSYKGNLAIANQNHHRVVVYNSVPNSNADADAYIGQPNGTTFGTSSALTGLNNPVGVAWLPDGRLVVGDNTNRRWNVYGSAPCTRADLRLTLTAANPSMACINTNTYTLTLTNVTGEAVNNVVVMAALPYGAGSQVITPSAGTYNSAGGTWAVPALAAGANATLTMAADFAPLVSQGTIEVMAGIWGGDYLDTDYSNNGVNLSMPIGVPPTISAGGTICAGQSFTLSATGGGSYAWSNGATTAEIIVSPASTTTYSVVVGAATPCTLSTTVTVTPLPAVPQLFGPANICAGAVTLTVADAATTREYSSNGGSSWQAFAGTTLTAATTGSWQVRNIASGCTTLSNVLNVTANPAALPGFTTGDAFASTTGTPTAGGWSIAVSTRGVIAISSDTRAYLYRSLTDNNPVVLSHDFLRAVAFTPDGSKLLISQGPSVNRVLVYNSIPTVNEAAPDVVIGQDNFSSFVAGNTLNRMINAHGAVVAPDGRLYIVDINNNRVLGYNSVPKVNGAFANFLLGSVPGTSPTLLNMPRGVTLTPDGKLILTDQGNRRVLVYNSLPSTSVPADAVLGQTDFVTGTITPGTDRFNSPFFPSVNHKGQLAVPDQGYNRVALFNSVPAGMTQPDAFLGQSDGVGATAGAGVNQMNLPRGAAWLPDGRLLVNEAGNSRWTVFGNAPCAQANLGLALTAANASMTCVPSNTYTLTITNPSAATVNNLVIMAALPFGTASQVISPSTGTYNSAGGTWSIPALPAGSSATLTMAGDFTPLNGQGSITVMAGIWGGDYVDTDYSNNGVNVVTPIAVAPVVSLTGTGTICQGQSTTLTASGGSSYAWAHGPTTAAITVSPSATTTYSVNITSGSCVITRTLTVTVNTTPTITYAGSNHLCQGQQLTLTATGTGPWLWSTGETTASITVSSANVYTVSTSPCSTASAAVYVNTNPSLSISPATPAATCQTPITLTATTLTPGVNTLAGAYNQGGYTNANGSSARLQNPVSVSIGANGVWYITEFNGHRIRSYNSATGAVSLYAGSATSTAGNTNNDDPLSALFNGPCYTAVDSKGNLFVAEYNANRLRKIDAQGRVSTLAGSGANATTDGTGTAAAMGQIYGLTIDRNDVLYAGQQDGSIRRITGAGVVTTLSTGQGVIRGIVVEQTASPRYLYLATDYQIKRLDLTNNTVSVYAGTGSTGSANGALLSASFHLLRGMTMTSTGLLYIADNGNHRIRVINTASSSPQVGTLVGSSAGGTDGNYASATFFHPNGLAVTPEGHLAVVDYFGHTLKLVTLAPSLSWSTGATTSSISAGTTGAYTATATNVWGCTSQQSANVTVEQPFIPTLSMGNGASTCQGSQLAVTNAASCVGCTWAWTNGGTASSTAIGLGNNSYGLTVTTAEGCQTTVPAIEITGLATGTWLGLTDSWTDAANWCGGVPGPTATITVPTNRPNLPRIDGPVQIANLTIPAGVTLPIAPGQTLTLLGNQSGGGSIVGDCTSQLHAGGSARQTIGPAAVGTLVVNNAEDVSLGDDLEVCTAITLASGNLLTNNKTVTLASTAGNPAESPGSRIIGRVRARGRSVGTGSLALFGLQLGTGADDLDTVYVERNDQAASFDNGEGISQTWRIRAHRQPSAGRVITLTWPEAVANDNDMATAQLWRRPEGGSTWLKVGLKQNLQPSGGYYSMSASTTSFSDWTVSSDDNPLPVTLLRFTGRRQGQWARLSWATASERMNKGFIIERSHDHSRFDSVGFVAGRGNSNALNHYDWEEQNQLESYYRLVQIDHDGTRTASPTIYIGQENNGDKTAIYPNPSAGHITVTGLQAATQLTICNGLGQVVFRQEVVTGKKVDLRHLPAGIYSCQVGEQVMRLVVK